METSLSPNVYCFHKDKQRLWYCLLSAEVGLGAFMMTQRTWDQKGTDFVNVNILLLGNT